MDRETVFACTEECYSGDLPSCSYACPFQLDLRSFMKKCMRGRWGAAYKELQTAVLFPAIIADLCPRPCMKVCQRDTVLSDDPLDVGLLEHACIDFNKKKSPLSYNIEPRPQKIAIIGAGPSGLSCGLMLAHKHFNVTFYDENDGWGGSLREHVNFLKFDQDIGLQFMKVEVEFCYQTEITSLQECSDYDAVFVATGKSKKSANLIAKMKEEEIGDQGPQLFVGGEASGLEMIEAMAQAIKIATSIEAYLLSGNITPPLEKVDNAKSTRYVNHEGVDSLSRVQAEGEFYTEIEAKQEASRCLQCDCTNCMDSCDLLTKYKKRPPRISNDVFMDGQSRNSVSSAQITRQTWSCNLCGNCANKCDVDTNLRKLFQLSRADRVENKRYPPALHYYWLREMDFQSKIISTTIEGKENKYAFFPGCRLGSSNPDYVLEAYDFLDKEYNAGLILNCCGIPAWWAGEDAKFADHLEELRDQWLSLGKPILVTACPSCARLLREHIPEIDTISLYSLLETKWEGENKLSGDYSLFSPCSAYKVEDEKKAVKALVEKSGLNLSDFDSDGQCCGFGGHIQLADRDFYQSLVNKRANASKENYIVYCTNCNDVFKSVGKESIHLLDIIFKLDTKTNLTLEEKKQNSLTLKELLTSKYKKDTFIAMKQEWDDIYLEIDRPIRDQMESGLITDDDVRKAIWTAEVNDEGFLLGQEILCSLDCGAVVYWVAYSKKVVDNRLSYHVNHVYSHRMKVREGV